MRCKAEKSQMKPLQQITLHMQHAPRSDTTSAAGPKIFVSPQLFLDKTLMKSQNIPKSVSKKLNSNYTFENDIGKGSTHLELPH